MENTVAINPADSQLPGRTELCCRTNMSGPTSPIDVEDLIKECDAWGIRSVAITDYMSVQSFPRAYRTVKKYGSPIKNIYGMEISIRYNPKDKLPVILLAANNTGLESLYTLLSLINTEYGEDAITEELLAEHAAGLMIGGTAEYLQWVFRPENIHTQKFRLGMFSYIQITPWDDQELNTRIVELAKERGIPVVASCTARVLHEEEGIIVKAWKHRLGEDTVNRIPYMLTTREMLAAFHYLDEQDALDVVVSNPNVIADRIKEISPVCPTRFTFRLDKIDNSDELLEKCCYEKAHAIYGEVLPEAVKARLTKELSWIHENEFTDILYAGKLLVEESRNDGYLVGNRGCLSASFVAFLAGITDVNPLKAHYYCSECGYFEEAGFTEGGTGPDLKEKTCPACGTTLKKDGYNIPAETFFGPEGNKEPDIDFNFAAEYQHKAAEKLKEIFGTENVFMAGTIGTVPKNMAYECIREYTDAKGLDYHPADIEKYADILCGAKITQGVHPGGYIVKPKKKNIHWFTPVRKHEFSDGSHELATHFEYHDVDFNFYKFDLLGHRMPGILHRLWELTGIDPSTIDISDRKIFELFQGIESIGLHPADVCGFRYGTLGIHDFANRKVTNILETYVPENINDLIRIWGLAHSTDGWYGNAEDLITSGTAKAAEVIAFRDDVFQYLMDKGFDIAKAYRIAHAVRMGSICRNRLADWDSLRQEMSGDGIPEWYIKSCEKIMYLFPKAHSASSAMLSLKLAYYKVYYPEAFYRAVLRDAGSSLTMTDEELTKKINRSSVDALFEYQCGITAEELLLILEMRKRGIVQQKP